jgi:hypothetical protein
MTETILHQAIFNVLQPILNVWLEGRDTPATVRAAGQVQLVWHMQGEPRMKTPIIEARLSGFGSRGRDYISAPYEVESGTPPATHLKQDRLGNRNFMLYLTYFGNGAIDQLNKVKDAFELQYYLNILRAGSCTAISVGPVIDAHVYLGTIPEDRASLDIEMRTWSEETLTDKVGIIEHLKGTGDVGAAVEAITLDINPIPES